VLACGFGLAAGACAAPAQADGGGAYSSVSPKVSSVKCVAGCSGIDAAQTGSVLRVRGRSMERVRKIVFLGGKGDADNITTSTSKPTKTTTAVTVPAGAASGRLRAVNDDGLRGGASRATVTIKVGSSGPLDARVIGQTVFQGAARPAQLELLAREPLNVVVVLARVTDGVVVQMVANDRVSVLEDVGRDHAHDGRVGRNVTAGDEFADTGERGGGSRFAADPGPVDDGLGGHDLVVGNGGDGA